MLVDGVVVGRVVVGEVGGVDVELIASGAVLVVFYAGCIAGGDIEAAGSADKTVDGARGLFAVGVTGEDTAHVDCFVAIEIDRLVAIVVGCWAANGIDSLKAYGHGIYPR